MAFLVWLMLYLQPSPMELVQRERTLAGDNGARIARARRGTPFKPAQVRYMNGTRVSGDVWYVMWGGTDASPALELDSIGAALHSTQSYSLLPGGAMTGYKHDNRKARHLPLSLSLSLTLTLTLTLTLALTLTPNPNPDSQPLTLTTNPNPDY